MTQKAREKYTLFIDELGTASPKDTQSPLYIVSGCSVNDREDFLQTRSDQIKFKYWGRTDIVFHSREMGRRENDFRILRKKSVREEFFSDMRDFLLGSNFKLFFVVIDKEKARKKNWNGKKMYDETSKGMIRKFLLALLSSDSVGKIVVESATAEKDFYFNKALGFFLAGGVKDLGIDYEQVQKTITSISFVTKKNFDIEEQIADLFAYAAKCQFLKQKRKVKNFGEYEEMIMCLLKKKLYRLPENIGERKKKFFDGVDFFEIIPK